MNPEEFLAELQKAIGGKIESEGPRSDVSLPSPLDVGRFPRLLADYQGFFVKVDFVIAEELILEVNVPPPHRLHLRHERAISRFLDRLHLSPEIKTGDSEFDGKYVVSNVAPEEARRTLTQDFKALIAELEPFLEFEMTHKEYRCLKPVADLSTYTPQQTLGDLDILINLAKLCQTMWEDKT